MGHPVLRARARPIEPAQIGSPRIQQLIDDMFETMQEYQGVGLAAPQVHESLRVFVAGFTPDDEDDESARGVPLMALINPEITPIGPELVEDWEGCLSIPDIRGKVPRYKSVRVQAWDRNGKELQFVANDFHARVIQHEWDHLNGKVYLDRMRDLSTLAFLAEFARFGLKS
jgi:peptide deformylase